MIARRPGNLNHGIVILAHRDAAAPRSEAELSGTAALLELARLFSQRITNRSITLVSTSGGTGGAAGAADFAAHAAGPVDAVIVLGDLAGKQAHRPFVVPWSDGFGSAPLQLQRTLENAITTEVGAAPGGAGVVSQFAHLAFPFTLGEQGVLNARGVPAVSVQVSGEQGPSPNERVSPARLQNFGRAVLRAINALDAAPAGNTNPQAVILDQRKVIPAWAVRLVVAALMLPALLATVDAFARVRRRRQAVRPWLRWTLSCALPFFACAMFSVLLARLGVMSAAPSAPVSVRALPVDAGVLAAVMVVLALAWVAWALLARAHSGRVGNDPVERPMPGAAGVAVLAVLDGVALVVWVRNPFTAALLLPALHLWLLVASPELRPRRVLALALVLAGVVLPAGVVALYAKQLGLGPVDVAWTAVLLVAGGHIGLLSAALWSLSLGCLVGGALIALQGRTTKAEPVPVTVRGPLTYAGPGSLGGTESALRR